MPFYEELEDRGLVAQSTHPEELRRRLAAGRVTLYTGFDPTADSLHVGHLIPIMGLARAQRAGHRPIALMGGGTALVGDPSGRSEMRRMLTPETIAANIQGFRRQLGGFLDFSEGAALLVNNGDWLGKLNYLEMLRDIGSHFSVNRMLTAECFKARLEQGLSFLEFNYMILQAYDFLELYRVHGCALQLGGDDQWSNMLAGTELIRRVAGADAFVLTYPLLTTSDGRKMGKTEKGAVWLDANKTSPYEYYQYWRNVPDDRVRVCLASFTFLLMDEVRRLTAQAGEELNAAKEVLAYEATMLLHGAAAATAARTAARAAFSGAGAAATLPATEIAAASYPEGLSLIELLCLSGLAPSNREARRLVAGGGIYINGERVENGEAVVSPEKLRAGIELRKGKKVHHRLIAR